MKKSVTYVAKEKFTALVESHGLSTKQNAGFVQVILGNGYHLYIGAGAEAKNVARVDIQWVPEGIEGINVLGEGEKIGRVVAQLDFGRTEDEILASFRALLTQGMGLPTWERPKRVMPGTVKARQEAAEASDEDKAARKAERRRLIEDQAKKMGVGISPKADI